MSIEYRRFTSGYATEENISLWPETTNSSSRKDGLDKLLPSSCWNVNRPNFARRSLAGYQCQEFVNTMALWNPEDWLIFVPSFDVL